jgi:hypothetical protein
VTTSLRLLALAPIVALLVGCAAPTPEGTDSAGPTPEPSMSEALPPAAPSVLPFDCADIGTTDAWNRLLGFSGLQPSDVVVSPFSEANLRQRGVGWCSWRSEEPYANVAVTVYLGEGRADVPLVPEWTGALGVPDSAVTCLELANHCEAAAVVGGYSLHAYAAPSAATLDGRADALTEFLAPAVSALQASPAPEAWQLTSDGWPAVGDCAAIAAASDVAAAAGASEMEIDDITGITEDRDLPRDLTASWGETSCRWRAPNSASAEVFLVDLVLLAGGAWLWRDLVPAASTGVIDEVAIHGADDAAFVCPTEEGCTLMLRFGPDVAHLDGSQDADVYGGLHLERDQLLALAATLAPALAGLG